MSILNFLSLQITDFFATFYEFLKLAKVMIPELNKGLKWSLILIIPSSLMALCLGVLVGTLRALGKNLIKFFLNTYVALFRGTPLVVQILVAYFGIFPLINKYTKPFSQALRDIGLEKISIIFNPPAYIIAILVFTLCSGAYQSEYIRGAILSINRGQFLAARALGFSNFKTFSSIVVPQAFRRALPGCGNEIIYLIKYSSLAYLITVMEITGTTRMHADLSAEYMKLYLLAAIYYLFLVSIATWILRKFEKFYETPGFAKV